MIREITSPSVGQLKLSLGMREKISGYEIQIAGSSDFSNITKSIKVSYDRKTVSFKSLSSKKICYARIRSYKKSDDQTCYSAWSKLKSIKVK